MASSDSTSSIHSGTNNKDLQSMETKEIRIKSELSWSQLIHAEIIGNILWIEDAIDIYAFQ